MTCRNHRKVPVECYFEKRLTDVNKEENIIKIGELMDFVSCNLWIEAKTASAHLPLRSLIRYKQINVDCSTAHILHCTKTASNRLAAGWQFGFHKNNQNDLL